MEDYGNDNPGAFQSSPSARRVTGGIPDNAVYQGISIPAFRKEGDIAVKDKASAESLISIPAFREEGDSKFQQEIAKTQGIKQPFLQTVTRTHFLAGKNPKVD